MKITKLGHCCLVIEEKGVTFLTDPGAYSTRQAEVQGIDAILITHEHADHLHIESLKMALLNNPKARVITNKAVSKILKKEEIAHEIVGGAQHTEVNGILLEGFGTEHEYIYETVPNVENTGYFVGNKLFYPGDAFTIPGKNIDVLALPVAGPWMRLATALDYAKQIGPRACFPVHDGMLREDRVGTAHRLPELTLTPLGIQFVAMKEGSVEEF